ncbi:MAG: hypothetical protein NWF00_12280 [Candidatus Bathyarchaeota archaeon]|nr:hypothetical protein [Candidatus Bathyarchaeota archaeon]
MSKPENAEFETPILVLLSLTKGANSRKNILITLLSGPKNCNRIAKDVRLNWWTVQKHLHRLKKENLVKSLDFGDSKFYSLSTKGEAIIRTFL